jgi:hypothetical protein
MVQRDSHIPVTLAVHFVAPQCMAMAKCVCSGTPTVGEKAET